MMCINIQYNMCTISNTGLKAEKGVLRVTVRKSKNVLFVIQHPEVYRSVGPDGQCTFVVFGEARVDLAHNAAQAAAERLKGGAAGVGPAGAGLPTPGAAPAPGAAASAPSDKAAKKEEPEEETGPVDETGLRPKDIELVMTQANVSRPKAIRALRENNSDLVNAIMVPLQTLYFTCYCIWFKRYDSYFIIYYYFLS